MESLQSMISRLWFRARDLFLVLWRELAKFGLNNDRLSFGELSSLLPAEVQ